MKAYQYQMPTKIIFGYGSFEKTLELTSVINAKKILLLASKRTVFGHFLQKKLIIPLRKSKKTVSIFTNIEKSDTKTISKALQNSKKIKPDIILAVGGGAIIDTAKICAALLTNKGEIKKFTTKKQLLKNKPIKLIAIPTTAGTGSEVSPFAVVWDSKEKKKYSFESVYLYPHVAIVDSELTMTMPAYLTACTGMDALAQAIEAYWAVNSNPISDIFSLKAISLVVNNLSTAVKNGKNTEARDNMAKAALFAGLAFSNTRTTICHSLSYPFTAHFNIAHGHAVSLTLAEMLKFSFSAIDKDKQKPLLTALGVHDLDEAHKTISLLMKKIGLESKLSKLNIKKSDFNIIIKEGFTPERANNAPKIPTKDVLKNILLRLY